MNSTAFGPASFYDDDDDEEEDSDTDLDDEPAVVGEPDEDE